MGITPKLDGWYLMLVPFQIMLLLIQLNLMVICMIIAGHIASNVPAGGNG